MFLISSFMSSTGDAPNLRMAGMTKKEIEKLSKAKYECKGEGEKCSICYCDFEEAENITILWCKHNYHSECIGKWLSLNSHCPLCKQSAKNVL